MSGTLQPPALAEVLDSSGRASPAYLEYLRAVSKAGNQATTAATSATGDASTALTQVTALLASPPVWGVGDYRPSAKTTLDPSIWLECDGSSVAHATYPDLYALIGSITGPGAGAGTFKLPSMPPVFDAASPGPGGPPVLRWFIRVL